MKQNFIYINMKQNFIYINMKQNFIYSMKHYSPTQLWYGKYIRMACIKFTSSMVKGRFQFIALKLS